MIFQDLVCCAVELYCIILTQFFPSKDYTMSLPFSYPCGHLDMGHFLVHKLQLCSTVSPICGELSRLTTLVNHQLWII